MNREQIIQMAREIAHQCCNRTPTWQNDYAMSRIMELIDASAVAEREACAKVCDEMWTGRGDLGAICSSAIRARGNT